MPVGRVQVGENRIRRDLGDIKALAQNIAAVGRLLHPIVVTVEGKLVAGLRRLEAVKLLGWEEIEVTIIGGENEH